MPIKKSTTGKAQAKTVSKPKVAVKSVVSNEALRSEIAELKKQIEALSSQCHSCCADLKELKSLTGDERLSSLLLTMSTSSISPQRFVKNLRDAANKIIENS